MKLGRALERFVLDLDLDWDTFNDLLFEAFEDVGCHHDRSLCQRILALMGLEDEAIQACLSYFALQGVGCDCTVILTGGVSAALETRAAKIVGLTMTSITWFRMTFGSPRRG